MNKKVTKTRVQVLPVRAAKATTSKRGKVDARLLDAQKFLLPTYKRPDQQK